MQKAFLKFILLFSVLMMTSSTQAQWKQTMKWKAIVSLGISYPFTDGFVKGSFAQPVNFPSVNLGIQRMFKQEYGLRLDYGFNIFIGFGFGDGFINPLKSKSESVKPNPTTTTRGPGSWVQ